MSNSDKLIQRRLVNCIRALEFLQLKPDEFLIPEKLKHVHKMIMHIVKLLNGKDMLSKIKEKTLVFAGL